MIVTPESALLIFLTINNTCVGEEEAVKQRLGNKCEAGVSLYSDDLSARLLGLTVLFKVLVDVYVSRVRYQKLEATETVGTISRM